MATGLTSRFIKFFADLTISFLQKEAFLNRKSAAGGFFLKNDWDCRNFIGPIFFRSSLNTLYFEAIYSG